MWIVDDRLVRDVLFADVVLWSASVITAIMFSNLKTFASSFAGQAAELLVPALKSPFEEFMDAWRQITNYFVEQHDETEPLRKTVIPGCMETMLSILREEERESKEIGDGRTGPCLEYMLAHKILETLCSLGHGDTPVGMKQQVLQFFEEFLRDLETPTIPHTNVYHPIKRLMRSCHTRKSHPLEEDYVKFLTIVASKLREDPRWAGFFFDEIPEKDREKLKKQGRGNGTKEFFLIEALTDLLGSVDASVVNRACLGLLDLFELPSPELAEYIVTSGRLADTLVDRLAEKCNALPTTLEELSAASKGRSAGAHVIDSFNTWADYVDEVFGHCQPSVATFLAGVLTERMLKPVLAPRLLQTAEDPAYTATFLLNNWLKRVKTPILMDTIVAFLLGPETRAPERAGAGEVQPQTRRVLIERCESLSPRLTEMTLRLFDTILRRNNEHAMRNLVLRNFGAHTFRVSTDDVCEVREIMNSWLELMPETAQSSDLSNESDYFAYFLDAQKQTVECFVAMEKWNEGSAQGETADKTAGSVATGLDVPFYEGAFLRTLLSKTERMLDSPYDEMLLVTGLLSHIAMFPVPALHSYLLDPFCKVPDPSLSLYRTLKVVAREMAIRTEQIPDFHNLLTLARASLDVSSQAEGEEENLALSEHLPFMHEVVLFEEFCKEITAVVLVKLGSSWEP